MSRYQDDSFSYNTIAPVFFNCGVLDTPGTGLDTPGKVLCTPGKVLDTPGKIVTKHSPVPPGTLLYNAFVPGCFKFVPRSVLDTPG